MGIQIRGKGGEICQRLKSDLIVIAGLQKEATSPCINAETAVNIIALIAEDQILVSDVHTAILKNVTSILLFEDDAILKK